MGEREREEKFQIIATHSQLGPEGNQEKGCQLTPSPDENKGNIKLSSDSGPSDFGTQEKEESPLGRWSSTLFMCS